MLTVARFIVSDGSAARDGRGQAFLTAVLQLTWLYS
jgi:hypothetical protein